MSIKESLIEVYKQQGGDPNTMPETTSGLIKVVFLGNSTDNYDGPVLPGEGETTK